MSEVADEVRQVDIVMKGVLLLTEDNAAPIGKPVGEAWLVRDVGI